MKHLRFALLVAGILSAGWAARLWRQSRTGTSLAYVVTHCPEGFRAEISVRTPLDTLVLRPLGHDLEIPLESLEALGPDGTPLPVERIPGTIALDESTPLAFTRYAVRPSGGRCTIRYTARPAVYKLGGACAAVKRRALSSGGFACAPGPNLFMVPEGPVASLKVSCPDARPDAGLEDLPVQAALDRLQRILAVWGAEKGGLVGSLQITFSPDFPAGDRQASLDWISALARDLENRLGPGPALPLLLVPPQPLNPLAVTDLTESALACELNPRTGAGKLQLAEGLALRWLGFSPESSFESPDPGAWLSVGLARLAAHRALAAVGEPWAGEAALLREFSTLHDILLLAPPSRSSKGFHGFSESRRVKAPCAALLLDWEVARLTGGRASLRDVWIRAGLLGDAEAAAAEIAGPEVRTLFSRWIRQENRLLHPFPFLARENPYGEAAGLEGASPQLRLLLTGGTQAYLETCGCKLSQSGGIARRQAAFSGELRGPVPCLALDLGGFFPYATRPGELDPLAEMEIRFYLGAMGRMGYAAAAVGIQETLHGRPFLTRMGSGPEAPTLLSADLDLAPEAAPFRVLDAGPLRIGLVGVTGDPRRWQGALRFDANLAGLPARDPEGVVRAVKACRAGGADRVVLLGAVDRGILDTLADAGAAPDLALDAEPFPLWSDLKGEAPPAWMGTYRGVLWARERMGSYGFSRLDLRFPARPGEPVRAAITGVDLDRRFPEDPGMAASLDAFYAGLVERPEVWGSFDPLFPQDPAAKGPFAGVQTCKSCHPAQHGQWLTTHHASAMRILVQEHRNFNPKCVVCHVTGMGREGGYVLSKAGHPMENVQCEVCHGAGAAHAEAPSRANIRRTPSKATCMECHNEEHAEQFETRFQEAWKKVRH